MTAQPGQPSDPSSADPARAGRPSRAEPSAPRDRTPGEAPRRGPEGRRARIRADISRDRAGGHRVPTWVMAVVLVVLVGVWIYFVVTA